MLELPWQGHHFLPSSEVGKSKLAFSFEISLRFAVDFLSNSQNASKNWIRSRSYLGLSLTIFSDYLRLSQVFSCCLRLSLSITDYLLISLWQYARTISGYLRFSLTIFSDYLRLSQVFSCCLRLSLAISGYFRLTWAILGYLRLSQPEWDFIFSSLQRPIFMKDLGWNINLPFKIFSAKQW